jgi:hypothetical protein
VQERRERRLTNPMDLDEREEHAHYKILMGTSRDRAESMPYSTRSIIDMLAMAFSRWWN